MFTRLINSLDQIVTIPIIFQIVCSRNENAGPEVVRAVQMLLQGKFYVPVIRSIDNSAPPFIGEPFTEAQVPDVSFHELFT